MVMTFPKSHRRCGSQRQATPVRFNLFTNARRAVPVEREGLEYDMQMRGVKIHTHELLR